MAKLDSLKEEIGWLKVFSAILTASDLSLIAWLAQNYVDLAAFLFSCCILAVILMTGGVVWIDSVAFRRMEELEEIC